MRKYILIGLITLSSTIAMADHLTLSLGDSAYLSECGGMISTNNGSYGNQLNVVLNDVRNCSNFDIISDDGQYVSDYKSKKIPGYNGSRSGSFTVPTRYNDVDSDLGSIFFGTINSIKVVVKSNSGKHQDHITIRYRVR